MPRMHPGLWSLMPHEPAVGPGISEKGLPESLIPHEPGVHGFNRQGSSPRGLCCMLALTNVVLRARARPGGRLQHTSKVWLLQLSYLGLLDWTREG